MSYFGDVLEYIVDGTSGLSPGDVAGAGMLTGVCSVGTPGQVYLLAPQSDLETLLGVGPLVDALGDFFAKAGQEAYVLAAPATGDVAGAIGDVTHTGAGTATTATAGTVKAAAQVVIEVLTGGALNVATARTSLDGGDSFGGAYTIPVDGAVTMGSTGVTITFTAGDPADGSFVAGDTYSFDIAAPAASVTSVLTAIDGPLDIYDVEYVHVVGPSDSTDWAALGVKADELWNLHRPTFFICETRLPAAAETIDEWVTAMVAEAGGFAHRFVVVCAGYGDISAGNGLRQIRNAGGILSGTITRIPVQRSIGNVMECAVANVGLPADFNNAHAKALDDAGFVTLRRYAGLDSVYFANGRTQAEVTSDYQFVEVLRVVFKAVRLSRIAALKSLQAEATTAGVAKVRADISTALDSMVEAIPQEMAGYTVNIPANQDIVNNGLAVEEDLEGIPIIRKIKLFFRYSHANPTA